MRKVAIVVVIAVLFGAAGERGYEWLRWQVGTPVADHPGPVMLTVQPGELPDKLAGDLLARGLIRDKQVFLAYFRYRGADARLRAGVFELDRSMSMARIVSTLESGQALQVSVRMPEGATLAMMAAQAQSDGIGSATSYQAAASDLASWQFDFLSGRPKGAPGNLEGFLYPDTYQIARGDGVKELIKRQLERFGQVMTPQLRQDAGQANGARTASSLYDVVVLASIVEKEVGKAADRPIVCDVFYNRLSRNIPLGSDATVLYAVGKTAGTPSQEDLTVSSPYNTRKFPGLPPGPISNPSLSSIEACVHPQKTNYLYFFTDPKGTAHYAATYEESLRQQQQFGLGESVR